jgi:large subunit ribosomal protein L30
MTEKKSGEKAQAPKAARPKKAAKDVDALVAEVAEVAVAAKPKPAKPAKATEAKATDPKAMEPKAATTIRIRQVGSGICTPVDHKQTLKALGLRRIRQEVVRPDTPATRGMVRKVRHLVTVVGE